MPLIQAFGFTYHGPADGEYGVFTDPKTGAVFAGSHVKGSACIGVSTETDGYTSFVECDPDGQADGRELVCLADGDTHYHICEHGDPKKHGGRRADGTCAYDGKKCSADFPPLVELRAKVLPIKARPTARNPQPPIRHSPQPFPPP